MAIIGEGQDTNTVQTKGQDQYQGKGQGKG